MWATASPEDLYLGFLFVIAFVCLCEFVDAFVCLSVCVFVGLLICVVACLWGCEPVRFRIFSFVGLCVCLGL